MPTTITESNLTFTFTSSSVLKFDGTSYYTESFRNCMPGNKGMDFLLFDESARFYFIEVKNFTGSENDKENIRRFKVSEKNSNAETETIENEIALKVKSTVAAMEGALLRNDADIAPYTKKLNQKKKVSIIVFVEGDITKLVRKKNSSREIAFSEIRRNIKRQLRWLDAKIEVSVESCSNYSCFLYTVSK